ncbi:MAG: hypothetical protein ACLQPH_09085 [Acidimicrobiales bacterium]
MVGMDTDSEQYRPWELKHAPEFLGMDLAEAVAAAKAAGIADVRVLRTIDGRTVSPEPLSRGLKLDRLTLTEDDGIVIRAAYL